MKECIICHTANGNLSFCRLCNKWFCIFCGDHMGQAAAFADAEEALGLSDEDREE
jgi:hypothetical protein